LQRGCVFAWAMELDKRLQHSLCLLADHVAKDERLAQIEVLHARWATSLKRHRRALWHVGFTSVNTQRSRVQRLHDACEDVLTYGLIWAFHPLPFQRRIRALDRIDIWISRSELLRRFGSPVSGCVRQTGSVWGNAGCSTRILSRSASCGETACL
jgi:hypothetical protein